MVLRPTRPRRPLTVVRAKRVTVVHVGPERPRQESASLVGFAHKHMRDARKAVSK